MTGIGTITITHEKLSYASATPADEIACGKLTDNEVIGSAAKQEATDKPVKRAERKRKYSSKRRVLPASENLPAFGDRRRVRQHVKDNKKLRLRAWS